jgi:prepilin-type N-terminal cleavage/methylation domain-containing protein
MTTRSPRSRLAKGAPTLRFKSSPPGFTLLELLAVMGIGVIMLSVLVVSLSGMRTSQDISLATTKVQGALDQARSLAMAGNTYTWVGFFEETAGSPGQDGTGQIVISIVSSNDGTRLYDTSSPVAQLPSASLSQAATLIRIPNTHLDVLTAAAVTRPTVPATQYEVGSDSFANTTTFAFPLNGSSQYTFSRIIQFSPQGEATRIADTPTPVMEIGLRPTHGTTIATSSTNVAAVQVNGLDGHTTVYRP